MYLWNAFSVCTNWINEARKWCPSLRAFKFHGDKEQRESMRVNEMAQGCFDLCVTTYEMASSEKAVLRKFKWHYIIIDEAQRIKNEVCGGLILLLVLFPSMLTFVCGFVPEFCTFPSGANLPRSIPATLDWNSPAGCCPCSVSFHRHTM